MPIISVLARVDEGFVTQILKSFAVILDLVVPSQQPFLKKLFY